MIPPIHNKRSPEQWQIISKRIDFKGKTVLDLGCGYGDILFRCWQAGASCYAVEQNKSICRELSLYDVGQIICSDIEQWIIDDTKSYDIIICFSVLPYLENPFEVLKWIKDHSGIALIEIQLDRDGPGSNDWLKGQVPDHPEVTRLIDNEDAYLLLRMAGWKNVYNVGETIVKKDRNFQRIIWMCK